MNPRPDFILYGLCTQLSHHNLLSFLILALFSELSFLPLHWKSQRSFLGWIFGFTVRRLAGGQLVVIR
jgi:hypothetical protein